jgi:UDP-3-O-[3-hydroxymyristoyl] glucosamine N-acyltransferase
MADGPRFTLQELAEALGAVLDGDPSITVSGVAPLETAGPEHVAFVNDARFRAAAETSRAGAFVAAGEAEGLPRAVLKVPAPRLALATLLRLFHPSVPTAAGVHPTAVVSPGAVVHPTASVGPFVVIEDRAVVGPQACLFPFVYVGAGAEVGEQSVLHPHVVLYEGARVRGRVVVHAGVVIGADGFGYAFDGSAHRKIPQVGGVVIEDDVEIGANTTVDRATVGTTVVAHGTKVDNLVQIGHNVEVGPHSIVAAQAGIAGSSKLGRHTILAGQVGIADHVSIGDGVVLGAQSGVPGDISEAGTYLGAPALPASTARRILAAQRRLPELLRRVRDLERRLAQLEGLAPRATDGPVEP